MFRKFMSWMRGLRASRQGRALPARWRYVPYFEHLGSRIVPSTANFFGNVLTVTGDDGEDDNIVVTRDAGGTLSVTDGGAPVVIGGNPTPNVAETTLIVVTGG